MGKKQWEALQAREPTQAGRAEAQAGRLCSPGSSPACHPSQLGSGVPGVLLAAVGELLEPVLVARHSPGPLCVRTAAARAPGSVPQCGLLPKYQPLPKGLCPLLNRGKAGEKPLGLRGEAEPGRPRVPSVLLQQMSAQGGGGGHPGITSGDFLSC